MLCFCKIHGDSQTGRVRSLSLALLKDGRREGKKRKRRNLTPEEVKDRNGGEKRRKWKI